MSASDRDKLARLLHDQRSVVANRAYLIVVTMRDAVVLADAVWAAGWRPAADVWDEGCDAGYMHGATQKDEYAKANPYAAPVVGDAGPPPTDTAAYHAEMQKLREERESLDG